MEGFLKYPIDRLPYLIVALLIGFTIHEYSHALIAYKMGDPTAKREGRLTLNPAAHLDVFGTLMIFVAGFGWAKPVPVNYFYLRDKRFSRTFISIAGPLSNLLVSIIFTGVYVAIQKYGIISDFTPYVHELFIYVINLNIILFLFNLIPIPPLDGYRVIEDLAPDHIRSKMVMYEQYGVFVFLILLITPLGDFIFDPIFGLRPGIYYSLIDTFSLLFNF